ncbi:hypothetical protein CXF68_04760 [Tenacibaculum sp. Bg11-29]|uniref:DUF5687 family protein n=1 Tax=Tenacibaculum sp. Bg11-29 TaxID=2058306 RepID=UPI000C322938|nr:DUF5687 family protein [Tenacibaculum sp. Bg11-29]PKH50058.1 hypothetical protein CXF68_04760 [Tenacibaculum sp. Bg11-29]
MITHFFNLEWKQYFRSSYWQKSIGIKILLGFFGLIMLAYMLLIGFFLFKGVQKIFPDQDPFLIVNSFLFFWVLGDLIMRFFLQKLPIITVKPLLTLPIKRSKIVNYVLGKSAISFFNFLPLFAIIPFGVNLVLEGYDITETVVWVVSLMIIVLIVNFLNFIIENLTAKTDLSFLPLIAISGSIFALDYFQLVSFSELVSNGILAITKNPVLILVLIAILIILYYYNYIILKNKLYVDSAVDTKIEEAKPTDLAWTNRFGDIAPFMQLDLKLLMRNKRSKSTLPILVIGLLYGLFFYPQPEYADKEFFFAFIGIFSTGAFLINFGQFIPAWDSGYYKMLMSQNFKYERYLKSKFTLMAISVIILFVLGIPYVYFGWKILVAHFAAAIYNIGVNSHVIMYGGSFNRKKINLDQKAAFNYQGTGAVQWLIGIPLMVVPMALFAFVNWLVNFEVAITVLIVLGLTGIVLHEKLMKAITKTYVAKKYAMINAFDQEN